MKWKFVFVCFCTHRSVIIKVFMKHFSESFLKWQISLALQIVQKEAQNIYNKHLIFAFGVADSFSKTCFYTIVKSHFTNVPLKHFLSVMLRQVVGRKPMYSPFSPQFRSNEYIKQTLVLPAW